MREVHDAMHAAMMGDEAAAERHVNRAVIRAAIMHRIGFCDVCGLGGCGIDRPGTSLTFYRTTGDGKVAILSCPDCGPDPVAHAGEVVEIITV